MWKISLPVAGNCKKLNSLRNTRYLLCNVCKQYIYIIIYNYTQCLHIKFKKEWQNIDKYLQQYIIALHFTAK